MVNKYKVKKLRDESGNDVAEIFSRNFISLTVKPLALTTFEVYFHIEPNYNLT